MEESLRSPVEFDAVDSIEYEPQADTYRVIRRADHPEPMSYAIVEAVCVLTEQTMLELNPLHDAINPDALESVLSDPGGGSTSVRFEYEGCELEVTGAGEITVQLR